MEEDLSAPSGTSGDETGHLLGVRRSLASSQRGRSCHCLDFIQVAGLASLALCSTALFVASCREGHSLLARTARGHVRGSLVSEEELSEEKVKKEVIVGKGDHDMPTVVTEQCVWHTCGDNTVCRLSSKDASIDGHNTTSIIFNVTTLRECKRHCSKLGEDECKGVEFNNASGRCELWSRPILSLRSCITGEDCPEANFSCHTMQCKAIDKPSKLRAEERSFKDRFGRSVDISGDTVIVGAEGDNDYGANSGAAYIFVRQADSFVEQAKLTAEDGYHGVYMGKSVSVSGDVALIGAYRDSMHKDDGGSAYFFRRSFDVWTQQAKIVPEDAAANQLFGYRVDVNGNTALVVSRDNPEHNISGAVYVFQEKDNSWVQTAKLQSPRASTSRFGTSVSLGEDTVMVGAEEESDSGDTVGVVYAFTRNGSAWSEPQRLAGDEPGDHFGSTVSLSGNTSFIGAHTRSAKGEASGAVYVFTRDRGRWTEEQKLIAEDADANDGFGYSVSVSDNTAVIGAYRDEHRGIDHSGSGYVFVRTGSRWVQQSKLAPNKAVAGAEFGSVTSISGSMAAFATSNEQAYVFPATLSQACPSSA
eukprot:TRINITY_DN42368_c0_g1_i1.p1 TRINITY_DN42368_c0_g1~~TRINITY_DN42368_c0_g1_i1.p1  ORF type:complete len:603 (+),score=105.12 TRINITY_DN42368_c0_g1_i1:47-1810(+)